MHACMQVEKSKPLESVFRICMDVSNEDECARLAKLVRERRGPSLARSFNDQPPSFQAAVARAFMHSDGFHAVTLWYQHMIPPDEAAEIKRSVSLKIAAHMERDMDMYLADGGSITAWLETTRAGAFQHNMMYDVKTWYNCMMVNASDALLASIMEREVHTLADSLGLDLARRIVSIAFDIEGELQQVES